MLILATYNNKTELYNCAPALLKKDFAGVNVDFFKFHIAGNNYPERKAAAADLAKVWSMYRGLIPDLSYSELITIAAYFERLAVKYGLIQEYRENAII